MTEQLAVSQLAGRARAVIGEEHVAVPRRPAVDGARDELLAGSALASNQHREVISPHALDLLGNPLHRGAGADKAGKQRLQRALERAAARLRLSIARLAQLEALSQHRTERSKALQRRAGKRARRRENRKSSAGGCTPDWLDRHREGRRRAPFGGGRQRPTTFGIATRGSEQLHVAVRSTNEQHDRLRIAGFQERGRAIARKQRRDGRGIDKTSHKGRVTVHLDADVATGRHGRHMGEGGASIREIRRGTQRLENRRRVGQISRRSRASACRSREPPEFEITESRLVAFAKQVEHADALTEVVIRLDRSARRRVQPATHAEKLPPGPAHGARLDAAGNCVQPLLRVLDPSERQQRFDGNQFGL